LDLAVDLGLASTLIVARGLERAAHEGGLRLEVGARSSGLAAYWFGDVAPFVSVESVLVPFPYDLALHTAGTLGHTPRAWVGGVLGLATRFE
jgi:hypothetical protein